MNSVPTQLREHQQRLQALDLSGYQDCVPYREEHWGKWFNDDQDFVCLFRRYPRTITRGNLAELACEAQENQNIAGIRSLFLATMLWGYGKTGYGPYRVCKGLQDPDALQVLRVTFDYVTCGNIREAYQQFKLSMCGPAFFTKYFYFVGLGCQVNPQPLILDSVVANALEKWLNLDIGQFASVTRRKETITAVGRNWKGYQNYLNMLNDWACQLRCRADSIELFLFRTQRQEKVAQVICHD